MNNTTHKLIECNSNNLNFIEDESVQLIFTSPPYPMIEMWDEIFIKQNPIILDSFKKNQYLGAYKEMHQVLNSVWSECDRVLSDSGFICINIGDATRTFNGHFQMYPNHAEIIQYFLSLGYSVLPDIIWRKQSNSPNKFMGSGMYPAGAYVTYEHEYILIFRKGPKRIFNNINRKDRQESAYFWEERNKWFSDLWDIKGVTQTINDITLSRNRKASFPLEIAYRIVNMYSVKNDTILDPFCGFGTTTLACILSQRNSIGCDIDEGILNSALSSLNIPMENLNQFINRRVLNHKDFIESLPIEAQKKCYYNSNHNCLVKTRQEKEILIQPLSEFTINNKIIDCKYSSPDKNVFNVLNNYVTI